LQVIQKSLQKKKLFSFSIEFFSLNNKAGSTVKYLWGHSENAVEVYILAGDLGLFGGRLIFNASVAVKEKS
jgi:hypothetical protein